MKILSIHIYHMNGKFHAGVAFEGNGWLFKTTKYADFECPTNGLHNNHWVDDDTGLLASEEIQHQLDQAATREFVRDSKCGHCGKFFDFKFEEEAHFAYGGRKGLAYGIVVGAGRPNVFEDREPRAARDLKFEAHFPGAARCWDGTGYADHRICYASAGWKAALASRSEAPAARPTIEMSPEFTDTARAALLWVLWHHQGGSSKVGQPIRFALGMGQHDHLNEHQVAEAKRWEALQPEARPNAAGQEQGWMPIATAPKDGRAVLIANDSPGSVHPREGYYMAPEHRYENEPKHGGWWRLAGSCEERVHGRTPTHWMPLPTPPLEAVGSSGMTADKEAK